MKCTDCKNIEYIDIGKKNNVKSCSLGLTATKKFLHYCGGFIDSRLPNSLCG